jgi:hypothetical protein
VKASLQTLRAILETACRKYDLDQCDLTVLSNRVAPRSSWDMRPMLSGHCSSRDMKACLQ